MNKSLAVLIVIIMLLSACQPGKPTSTPTLDLPESAIAVLTEVLQGFDGCKNDARVVTEENKFWFTCNITADSGWTVLIMYFDSVTRAQAQFKTIRGNNPVLCFHGYDYYELLGENPNNPFIAYEQSTWQAEQWLVTTEKFYDTHYSHSSGRNFQEEVYNVSVKHQLFPNGNCPQDTISSETFSTPTTVSP